MSARAIPLVEITAPAHEFTGERRKFKPCPSLPLRWPSKAKERYDLFDTWHDIAMQIVDRNKGSFRLLAVAKKVFHWESGSITASNAQLAARSGRCSVKTITRCIDQYVKLGIVSVTMGWRKRSDGHIVRTRTITLAIPKNPDPSITIPDLAFGRDH